MFLTVLLFTRRVKWLERILLLHRWDPFNAVIVTEYAILLRFNDVIEDITFMHKPMIQQGLTEKIIEF